MTPRAGRAALWTLLAAKLLSAWGVQWDIEWHVVVGRDSFWIAPHLLTYVGVGLAVVVSWGALAVDTWRPRGREPVGAPLRLCGLAGSRGFHLAAWGIALTVLAAPLDDLWHRLFGLDVTLWSPPHLLGIAGAIVNAWGCLVIAREVHGPGPARTAALVVGGALCYGALHLVVQPASLTAYRLGGPWFFTLPLLSALLLPLALVPLARLSAGRGTPLAALGVLIASGLVGQAVAGAGFAWLQPAHEIEAEILKDPDSPVALARAIARENGRPPGRTGGWAHLPSLLPVAALVLVDARRRPVAATVAYAGTLFLGVGWAMAGLPAFAPRLPAPGEAALALALTLAAALAGAVAGARLADALAGRAAGRPAQTPSPSTNSRLSVPV
jgi:hypothetical protein